MRFFGQCRPLVLFAVSLVLLAASIGLLAQEPPSASNWAQFRGPSGQAVTSAKLPTTWSDKENLAWKTELPGPGTSSPIIFGDRIFLTCYTGYDLPKRTGKIDDLSRHLVCLKRATGKLDWKKDFKAVLPESERIRDDHGYATNTPVADKDRVYVFFGKSGVYAFTHEGKQVWHADDVGSKVSDWGSAASPILFGDLVIVNASVESESLIALDRKTGKEKWRAKGIKESWNTPILVKVGKDRTELVVAIAGKILGFDPASGKQRWSCATDIGWYMVPSMVAHDGIVYVLGGRSGTAALAVRAGGEGDVTRTHRLWTREKGSNVTSPIYHDGHLYWMNDAQPIAYCAEAKTGKIVYEQRVAGRLDGFYSSPILADGKLYYTSRNGYTVVIAAKPKYEKLETNQFQDRSLFFASPAVTGNRLLIRSDKYLYCVEKK